jgi:hypothetical protein
MTGTEGEFEKLAYEAALRGLDKQERLLEELRARTGVLLAAASVAAPFLGQKALESPSPRGLTSIALAAFVISIGASVFVLVPRKKLAFVESGRRQYEALYHLRHDTPEVYRRLAYSLDRFGGSSASLLDEMIRACTVAGSALVVEILCIVVMVIGGAS